MRRLGLALLVVATSSAPAAAGTYLGLGIGTSPAVSYDNPMLTDVDTDKDGRSGRVLLGWRFGRLGIEGSAGRFDLFLNQAAYTDTTLGAALKYSLPLGDNFEFYGRGGLQRSWLTTGEYEDGDAVGNGYLLGAGFEYRLNLGLTGASVFVDYQYANADVTNDRMGEYTLATRMFTLGATVSL